MNREGSFNLLVLGLVYKILSCQYLINIYKVQGLMYTRHVKKQYLI